MKKPIRVAAALAAFLALTLCLAGCGSPNVEKTPEPAAPAVSQQQSDKGEEAADSQEKEEKAAKEDPKASQESAEQDSKAPAEKASSKKDSSTSSKATASQAKDQKKASKKPGADSEKSSSSKNSSSTAKKPASNSSNSSNGSNSSGSSPSNSQEKPQAPATKTIQVTVSIDGAGYISAVKNKKVELEEGATVFDALKKAATSIGGNKRYVSSINGLAEKEHGALSGWMYDVNGSTPMVPCGQYELKNGDSVLWHYENAQD